MAIFILIDQHIQFFPRYPKSSLTEFLLVMYVQGITQIIMLSAWNRQKVATPLVHVTHCLGNIICSNYDRLYTRIAIVYQLLYLRFLRPRRTHTDIYLDVLCRIRQWNRMKRTAIRGHLIIINRQKRPDSNAFS